MKNSMKNIKMANVSYVVASICIIAAYVMFALGTHAVVAAVTLFVGILGMCLAVSGCNKDEFENGTFVY